jgi:hypothetical protein
LLCDDELNPTVEKSPTCEDHVSFSLEGKWLFSHITYCIPSYLILYYFWDHCAYCCILINNMYGQLPLEFGRKQSCWLNFVSYSEVLMMIINFVMFKFSNEAISHIGFLFRCSISYYLKTFYVGLCRWN